MIMPPYDAFEILKIFENIMENRAFAPISIIFSKVFKTLLNFFLIFVLMLSKNKNAVMI